MRLLKKNTLGIVFLAAALCAPVWGANPALPASPDHTRGQRSQEESVQPGTINYVEGQVSIGNQKLHSNAVGSTKLRAGQILNTGRGKAEVLLTPGVFLRVGSNSAITMVSPGLADTEVNLERGRAMVEVDQIHRENNVHVAEDGTTVRLLKNGLYSFNANPNEVRVFKGQARVRVGDHKVEVKGDHQLALSAKKLKSEKFDKKVAEEGALYRFSKLRSDYLAEANTHAADRYVYNGWYGPGWIGGGWYWEPWLSAYTFIPGDGVLYSPFGWEFYSPLALYQTPYIYGNGYDRDWGARNMGNRGFYRPAMRESQPAVGEMSEPRGEMGGFHGADVDHDRR